MRALFVTQWFEPEPGASRGLPLARWLLRKGHAVKVLTGFPNYPGGKVYPGYRIRLWQRETMDGVPVLRVPLYPSHDRSAIRRASNYASFAVSAATVGALRIGGADVVFAYHPPATIGLPALVLCRARTMPFVYHIADMWPESVTESRMVPGGAIRQLVERMLAGWCRLLYEKAGAITVISPGFKRLLTERGVPGGKIHVIYNWADEGIFHPVARDSALAEDLGFRGRFNVVYAGNLGVFQGLETVIRAASLLKHLPDVQLVMVGTGQRENELKALGRELGAGNVRFLGRQPHGEMPQIYSLADVLLVHLRDLPFLRATIPSKTQVSLACGRPILMAVGGDAADLVREAGAGITCQPENHEEVADAIARLYGMNREQRETLGENGRRFYLREMSLEAGGGRMESLFHEVIRQHRNGLKNP